MQEVVNVAYTIGLDVSEAWENMGQAVMAALGSITMETMTAVVEDSLAAANITVQVAVVSVTEPQLEVPDAVVAEKPPDLLSAASKVLHFPSMWALLKAISSAL